MHGIEKVTDRIAQDAQAEIEAQLSQAQERADQILAEYETQAREAVERILAAWAERGGRAPCPTAQHGTAGGAETSSGSQAGCNRSGV